MTARQRRRLEVAQTYADAWLIRWQAQHRGEDRGADPLPEALTFMREFWPPADVASLDALLAKAAETARPTRAGEG